MAITRMTFGPMEMLMLARRSLVLGSIAVIGSVTLTGTRGLAAEQSAQDFLAGIYQAYKGKDAKGLPLNARGAPARYFTPALARLIDAGAKAAAKRGDAPALDGDPFIDAQDFEINAFAIEV